MWCSVRYHKWLQAQTAWSELDKILGWKPCQRLAQDAEVDIGVEEAQR